MATPAADLNAAHFLRGCLAFLGCQPKTGETFHDLVLATEKSNPSWNYAYALGYASGRCDAEDGRPKDHRDTEADDYALGYHKGYADHAKKHFALKRNCHSGNSH